MVNKPRWKGIILEYRGWVIRRVDRDNLGFHRVNDSSKEFAYPGSLEYALKLLFDEVLLQNCLTSKDKSLKGIRKTIEDTKHEFGVLLSPRHGIKGYPEGVERLKKHGVRVGKGKV